MHGSRQIAQQKKTHLSLIGLHLDDGRWVSISERYGHIIDADVPGWGVCVIRDALRRVEVSQHEDSLWQALHCGLIIL